ncbi:hypothetical protein HYDPIDRAFT_105685 [Hydnomerulius pinastri MD-312]|nr:hypothetical protein HYDPIDRAFT_105685 [Hydnomerulius pinastri MD-312]
MKRGSDLEGENDPKKPRTDSDDDIFHESQKRSAKDLPQLGIDDSGYIQGKVFMIWPARHGYHRLNLEVVEDSEIYRFEVEVPNRDGIAFRPHERVCLALKGARSEKRKESSAPHYLPVTLKYPEGVVLKYLSGANQGKVFNTWEGNTHADEWYNPGTVRRVSDVFMNDASEIIVHSPVPEAQPPRAKSPRPEVANERTERAPAARAPTSPTVVQGNTTPVMPQSPVEQLSDTSFRGPGRVHKESKAQKKRRKREERELPANRPPDKLVPQPAAGVVHGNEHSNSSSTYRRSGNVSRINPPSTSGQSIPKEESRAPALQSGFRTEMNDTFTALKDLRKGPSMVNIVGVVTSVNAEKQTRTGDWSRSFTVVDPSKADYGYSLSGSVTVNSFQKKYLEWLPQVNEGDVVILRKLKVSEFNNDIQATGFSDKLRWAVYDPATHGVRPPNKGDAPDKEKLDDGMGYEYSPYWEPNPNGAELQYCRQMTGWWRALQERRAENVTSVRCVGPSIKVHRLISEASPELPPKGFFNCTVEILRKFDNNGGALTVYVTDYTSNPHVHPVQATWCAPELSDRILQFEMWDTAKDISHTMTPGEYWYFHNARVKWNPSHYMEGTMQHAEKVTLLDEGKVESLPHLKALLARKKEFEENRKSPAGSGSSHTFLHTLVQDVDEETEFFTCTVELLHVDLNSRDDPCIYVTDYTFRHDLPANVSTADWARGLDHRVIKIVLDDAQAKSSLDLCIESFYTIRNLRFVRRAAMPAVFGRLGGQDTLIIPLHDFSSEQAQTLRHNKGKWQREMLLDGISTISTSLPNGSVTRKEPCKPPSKPAIRPDDSTIQQVLSSPICPNKFTVVARAVDFFPFHLEDACVLRCTTCKSDVPLSLRGCPRCDDMLVTHSEWFYCLYLRLQDNEGTEITVSLSGKECTLLKEIEPADFRYDIEAFDKFTAKLSPIIGNLGAVHQAWSKNQDMDTDSPQMRFTFESWNVRDERGYGLISCVLV